MTNSPINPTVSSERIHSLDFLRGIAILGIVFINIEIFAIPNSWNPWKYGFDDPIDRSARFWVYFLTQGKFYTIFAMLFGIGFYIFLERLEQKGLGLKAMDIYARRLLWLFIIGIVHAYFIWDGDVLYHYAICGLLLFPFRSISTKHLVLAVITLGAIQLNKSYDLTLKRQQWHADYLEASKIPEANRTDKDNKKIKFWVDRTTAKTPDTTRVSIKKLTYAAGLKETYEEARVHKGEVYYQGLLFPSLLIMIIGIMLYRQGIFNNHQIWKYYWPVSLITLSIGLFINYLKYQHWTYEYFNPITNIWTDWLFTFRKEALALGYVLIINGLFQTFLKSRPHNFISNIGRMALSNYIFQNIVLGLIFYGYGFAQYNQFSRFEILGFILPLWILQAVLSSVWLKYHQHGPLEFIWKKLTYNSFSDVPSDSHDSRATPVT